MKAAAGPSIATPSREPRVLARSTRCAVRTEGHTAVTREGGDRGPAGRGLRKGRRGAQNDGEDLHVVRALLKARCALWARGTGTPPWGWLRTPTLGPTPRRQPMWKDPRDLHVRSARSPLCLGRGLPVWGHPALMGGEAVGPGVHTSGPFLRLGPLCFLLAPAALRWPAAGTPPCSGDLFPACSGKEPCKPQNASFDIPPPAGPGATATRVIRVHAAQASVTLRHCGRSRVTCPASQLTCHQVIPGAVLCFTDEEAEHRSVAGLSRLLASDGRRGAGACSLAGAGENRGSVRPP